MSQDGAPPAGIAAPGEQAEDHQHQRADDRRPDRSPGHEAARRARRACRPARLEDDELRRQAAAERPRLAPAVIEHRAVRAQRCSLPEHGRGYGCALAGRWCGNGGLCRPGRVRICQPAGVQTA